MKKLILETDKVTINIFNNAGGSNTPKVYRTVILKPNIINGANVLSQDLFIYNNTKYIIKYTYDLLEETITVPENCIIEFDGGSINNGTLVGQNTGLILLWGNNTATFAGTWKNLIESSESIEEELAKKVDKVPGKQLSTNDFTNTHKDTLENLANIAITGDYADLINKPDFADVATSGSYLDLTDKPEDSAIIEVTLTEEIDQFTLAGTTDVTLVQFQQMLYNYKHNIFVKCNINEIDTYYKFQGYISQDQTAIFGPDTDGSLILIVWRQEGQDVVYHNFLGDLLSNKVDKIEGKGLSTNDYTNDDKTKLEGILAGAEVNVNPDWDALSGDALILNKPTTLAGYGITDAASSSDVQDINAKIPAQASAQNQLADKDFVNSSVSTATATFRGTSAANLTENQFLAWANSLTKDNNDYVFWNTKDTSGNTVYKRYKYDGNQWVFEYDLNNSSFTSDQWAAIQSGITSDLVGKLSNLPDSATLNTLLSNKVDKVSGKGLSTEDYTTVEKNKLAGIASGAEVNVQSDWNESDSNSDSFIKNKPTIPDISGKADKVSNATNGHLAGLDANGNLTDSGVVATNVMQSSTVKNVVVLTQTEFDALTTYDNNTEYNII